MKWFKRIVLAGCVLVLLLGVLAGVAYVVSKSKPDWYRSRVADSAAARSAEDKLVNFQAWVAQVNNWPHVQDRPRVDTDPQTAPSQEQSIELTEQELNYVLSRALASIQEKLSKYLADPYVALRDGHIILAGTSKDMDNVMSIYIRPSIDASGLLNLSIDSLRAGSLPVPGVLWRNYVDRLQTVFEPKLENARLRSHIEADGSSNSEAVESAMSRLLLNMLRNKSSDAVLFLPYRFQEPGRGHPVKVQDISIKDEKLSLKVVTMSADEQQQLLTRLRAPLNEEPPPPIAVKQ